MLTATEAMSLAISVAPVADADDLDGGFVVGLKEEAIVGAGLLPVLFNTRQHVDH